MARLTFRAFNNALTKLFSSTLRKRQKTVKVKKAIVIDKLVNLR